jgi:Xaa-Pro aminopeptidase
MPSRQVGYAERADRVRQRFDEQALLVTNLTNVRWLTGFTGSNGWVAILPDRLVLGTDGRYGERAGRRARRRRCRRRDPHRLHARPSARPVGRHVARSRQGVGAEASALTHAAWMALAAEIEIVPSDGHVEVERRVKDAGEIARIARAARIADAAARCRRSRRSATARPKSTSATSSSTECVGSVPTDRATTRSWHPVLTTPPVRTTRRGRARSSKATPS